MTASSHGTTRQREESARNETTSTSARAMKGKRSSPTWMTASLWVRTTPALCERAASAQ